MSNSDIRENNTGDGSVTGKPNTVPKAVGETNSKVGNNHPISEEDILNAIKQLSQDGRLVIQVPDLDKFDQNKDNFFNAYVNEVAWDKHNIPYIMRMDSTGKIVAKSAVKELYDMFKNLQESGALDNAYAWSISGKIYNMYFDATKKWVSINPELLFDATYRYYAIRDLHKKEDGTYNYLTGVYGKNPNTEKMELLTPYVDFDIIPNPSGDNTQVAKPRQTALLGTMINGGKYVVEFLDEDKVIRSTEVFQAISVRALEWSLAPDQCITGLIIKPNNEMPEPNSCFVYSNDDPKQVLNFRAFLKYADDTLKDITHHQFSTGRLVIDGVDRINTSILTDSDNPPQEISITYYFAKDNSDVENGELADGGNLDIGTLSITQKIKVYVKESLFDDVVKVIPAGWITYPGNNPNQKILMKLYGIYKSGTLKDITLFVSSNNRFSGFASSTSKYDKDLRAFTAASQYIGAVPETIITKVPQGRGTTLKSFQNRYESSTSHRRLIIDNEPSVFIRFDRMTKQMRFDGTQTIDKIKEINTYDHENVLKQPTHFNVRSALDPAIVIARNVQIEKAITGFAYTSHLDDVLCNDYPLIVEFMAIEMVDGMIDKVFATNASRYYAVQQGN